MSGELGDVLEDAERFQRLFVTPAIDAIRTEMQAHLAPIAASQRTQATTIETHGKDIESLKGTQRKVLAVWSIIASIGGAGLTAALTWLKGKFHIG
jgi:hypothetical protein